jgi:hypothetical protein
MTKKPRDPTDTSHPLYDPTEDPTHRFYLGRKTEGEPDPSDEDTYKVGPGFPPNEHKWKEGCPSPNPNGRPKKNPSLKPDIKKIFEDALNEKIEVTKANKKIVLTKLAMGFQQLATQWAKGDRHARRDVFTYAAILGVDLQPKEVIAEALGVTHEAIVEAFLRSQQPPPAEPSPEDHVKAPPDLIDDDVTKSPPNEAPAASPQPDTQAKKAPAPPIGTPAYIAWLRERNIAQQKKNQGES